jgi:ribose transport system ATP-binding protein
VSTLLEISQVSKSFGPTHALRNASLSLRESEIHALVGENGAGKSTLMKILAGVIRKDSGRISFRGTTIDPTSPRAAQQLGISTVFQELSSCNNLTVAENIFANREPASYGIISRRRLNRLTDEYLKKFEFAVRPDILVGDLNLAQKQMVEILKAISSRSYLLILDEPTSSLERTEVQKLFQLLRNLKAEGTSIIFITHKLDEVFDISDRVTVFRDGERVTTVNAGETNHDEIIRSMIGREIDQVFPAKADKKGSIRLSVHDFSHRSKFKHIAFHVRSGEVLGVAGLTGSGRSEVMQSVFGYLDKERGQITLDGVDIEIRSPEVAIHSGIVYSPEDRKEQGLFLNHSIAMNVVATCLEDCSTSFLVSRKKESNAATGMMNRMGIKAKGINQQVQSLSGGNQQKVLLAKCLASKPKVLIVDEPTRGIDIGSKIEIYHLLREFAQQGGAVIMISSELSEIIGLSDRVIVLKEGRVAGELQTGITERAIMELMFKKVN